MLKAISTLTVAGAMLAGATFAAQAMPTAQMPTSQSQGIILVAGGCGLGWHRGPYGRCVRNWGFRHRHIRCWWRRTPWGPRRICRRVW